MPKTLNFTLSEPDLALLAQAIKADKRPEVRQRAIGLRLLHEGHAPQAVGELLAVSQPTVYSWHHRWQAHGLEGLAQQPKSGRRRTATSTYVDLLAQVIEQDPQALGYSFTLWTVARLQAHMQAQTGLILRPTQFRSLLKENKFVYRRPKHDLTNLQDPQARETAQDWLAELKKVPKPARSTSSLWTKAP